MKPGSGPKRRGTRALLALMIGLMGAVLPLSFGALEAQAALDYKAYNRVYEVNDFSFNGNTTAGYPNSTTLNCVDMVAHPLGSNTVGDNQCTFKEALRLANGGLDNVLITIDVRQLTLDYKTNGCFQAKSTACGGAYVTKTNAPVINLTKITSSNLMCDASNRVCGDYDAEDGRAAYEVYTSGSITVDFQDLLGIATWEDGAPYYTTIYISSNNVKLLHINGVHSNETAIMLADGVTNIEIGYGSTENYLMTDTFPWSAAGWGWKLGFWGTERFLVIPGTHALGQTGINLHDWASGHLYDGAYSGYSVLLQKATVEGMTIKNFRVYAGLSGGCTEADQSGCATSAVWADGETTLTKTTIDGLVQTGGRSTRLPIDIHGSNMTINGMVIKNSVFTDQRGTSLDFNQATVTGLQIIGDEPGKGGTYQSQITGDASTTNYSIMDFTSAKLTSLTISNTLMKSLKTSEPCLRFEGATVSGVTFSGNRFESLTTTSYGIVSFHNTTQASNATAAVKFSGNTFYGNAGGKGIVTLYRQTGFWLDFQNNTFDSNYTTLQDGGADPVYGGHLVLGRSGYYYDTNPAHGSLVKGNTFINTSETTTYKQAAIFWKGDLDSTKWNTVRQSNLQILSNTFKGYSGTSIYLRDVGGVRVQYNTFLASNAHVAAGSTYPYFVGEDTNPGLSPAHGAPRYILNAGYANKDVKAWNVDTNASTVKVSQYGCSAQVSFKVNGTTPPVPYVVDVYASADESVAGTPIYSRTITDSSIGGIAFTFPLGQVAGKYLRTQVTSLVDGVYQSSQFGTAALIPITTCEVPNYSITKQAYTDSKLGHQIPAGSTVNEGTDVYWVYSVTNHRTDLAENLVVVVTDAKLDDSHGNQVCQLNVAPGATESCTWHQPVYPDGS
ncbi:MAG: hypothetical protein LBR27_10075 [Bifidobacteriaceae bacterium]|nr:hypothetical protein [Bifidobacteriaceae bacterium]